MSEIRRYLFWDVVKGVSIIAVILIHTTQRDTIGGIVWRQFINFPVALFFFMAGYFCHVKESYGKFLVWKAKRLLVPFTVVSLIYGAVELYFVIRLAQPLTLSRILGSFASFPLGWGYFVVALFQCVVLSPFLQKRVNNVNIWRVAIALYLVTVLYIYFASTVFYGRWTLANSIPSIFCTAWLPFFILGLRMQKRRSMFWLPGIRTYATLAFLIGLSIASGIYWYDTATGQLARSQLRLSCVLFSLILANLLTNLADRYELRGFIWGALARLGEVSFFVYLWHRLVLISLRSILPQFIEFHCIFVITLFVVIALFMPRTLSKRLWWIGL